MLDAGRIFYISETRLLSWLQSVLLEGRGRSVVLVAWICLFCEEQSRCCRFIFVFRAPLKLVDDVLYLDKNSGARYGEIDFILRELD